MDRIAKVAIYFDDDAWSNSLALAIRGRTFFWKSFLGINKILSTLELALRHHPTFSRNVITYAGGRDLGIYYLLRRCSKVD